MWLTADARQSTLVGTPLTQTLYDFQQNDIQKTIMEAGFVDFSFSYKGSTATVTSADQVFREFSQSSMVFAFRFKAKLEQRTELIRSDLRRADASIALLRDDVFLRQYGHCFVDGHIFGYDLTILYQYEFETTATQYIISKKLKGQFSEKNIAAMASLENEIQTTIKQRGERVSIRVLTFGNGLRAAPGAMARLDEVASYAKAATNPPFDSPIAISIGDYNSIEDIAPQGRQRDFRDIERRAVEFLEVESELRELSLNLVSAMAIEQKFPTSVRPSLITYIKQLEGYKFQYERFLDRLSQTADRLGDPEIVRPHIKWERLSELLLVLLCQEVSLRVMVHIEGHGDISAEGGERIGKGFQLEGLMLLTSMRPPRNYFDLKYRALIQEKGWTEWAEIGVYAGFRGEGKEMQAVEIKIDGELNKLISVSYKVEVRNDILPQWVSNGVTAGGSGECITALTVKIHRNGTAP